MPKLRTILFLVLLIGVLWHFYGDAFQESGYRGTYDKMKHDVEEIMDSPRIALTLDTLKQEFELLWNKFSSNKENTSPTEPTPEAPKLTQPTDQTFSIHNIEIGDMRSEVEKQVGKPNRSTLNEYGVEWATYHENYHNFLMVAYDSSDKVAGLYTNQDLLSSKVGITFNSTRKDVLSTLDDPIKAIRKGRILYQVQETDEYNTFLIDNNYVTIFYDLHENNRVTAIQIISADLEKQKAAYFGDATSALQQGLEYQLFDLTNAERVKRGLSVLSWEEPLRKTARDHSADMAKNNYFSHENLEGKSPFDRMADDAISFRGAGENLATGQPSSIFAHEGLMNSLGHRENILKAGFDSLAVGVAFNEENQPFYTENFLRK
ncbi:CAP domain-containing protein [Ornithinibacillus sp. BX22]|uniref:CAP domain-containing protein n=1 Tax=Ornithinibacillus hominis TaxID=2763055 RepID=A0A923L4V0_9BACI|nr:CAP domain-containing protein [Ornithinibacillus hominis]MBC5636436.1 CAP domain-containing protein [Ornithinibacillus hominis]